MIPVHSSCAKIVYKKVKKPTLANIGRLDNKKFVKFEKRKQIFFFHSALLHKRFMSEVPTLDGQIMCRGWGSH